MDKKLWTEGVQWDRPLDLSFTIRHARKWPQCFGASPPIFEPFRAGDYIGAIEQGSPVNFYNIHVNPHGTTTHTECYGHIRSGHYLTDCISKFLYNSYLTDANLTEREDGDCLVMPENLDVNWPGDTEALIVRTPGIAEYSAQFTGKNPVYFDKRTIEKINETGIEHLLVEWPSIDREEDGGKLSAHHAFWFEDGQWQKNKTITELIQLPENIQAGKYVLNLQVLAIDLDVSPSRPVLYAIKS